MAGLFSESNVQFVLRTLLRLGAPSRDAEDLAQEVFVVAHRRGEIGENDALRAQPLRDLLMDRARVVLNEQAAALIGESLRRALIG